MLSWFLDLHVSFILNQYSNNGKQWYLKYRGRPLDTCLVTSGACLPGSPTICRNFPEYEWTPSYSLVETSQPLESLASPGIHTAGAASPGPTLQLLPSPGPTLQLLHRRDPHCRCCIAGTHTAAASSADVSCLSSASEGLWTNLKRHWKRFFDLASECIPHSKFGKGNWTSHSNILDNMNTMHLISLISVKN